MSATLIKRAPFEGYVTGLPHCFIVYQWGNASVAKIGTAEKSKVFAVQSETPAGRPVVSFKCSDMSFEMLQELEGIRPAPYFARAKWVEVGPEADLNDEELRAYLGEAHRLILGSLPKSLRLTLIESIPVA